MTQYTVTAGEESIIHAFTGLSADKNIVPSETYYGKTLKMECSTSISNGTNAFKVNGSLETDGVIRPGGVQKLYVYDSTDVDVTLTKFTTIPTVSTDSEDQTDTTITLDQSSIVSIDVGDYIIFQPEEFALQAISDAHLNLTEGSSHFTFETILNPDIFTLANISGTTDETSTYVDYVFSYNVYKTYMDGSTWCTPWDDWITFQLDNAGIVNVADGDNKFAIDLAGLMSATDTVPSVAGENPFKLNYIRKRDTDNTFKYLNTEMVNTLQQGILQAETNRFISTTNEFEFEQEAAMVVVDKVTDYYNAVGPAFITATNQINTTYNSGGDKKYFQQSMVSLLNSDQNRFTLNDDAYAEISSGNGDEFDTLRLSALTLNDVVEFKLQIGPKLGEFKNYGDSNTKITDSSDAKIVLIKIHLY